MMIELMKSELEQLKRQVTDMICRASFVKRYVVPAYVLRETERDRQTQREREREHIKTYSTSKLGQK